MKWYVLHTLSGQEQRVKELLEERGRLDAPGRPMQFGTTAAFLRCFGLSSLEELPPVDERGALIAQLEFQET